MVGDPDFTRRHRSLALASSDLCHAVPPRCLALPLPFVVAALVRSLSCPPSRGCIFFRPVSTAAAPPAAASVMLLIAGGIALAGYPIGAASSERFGRVPTVSGFAIL